MRRKKVSKLHHFIIQINLQFRQRARYFDENKNNSKECMYIACLNCKLSVYIISLFSCIKFKLHVYTAGIFLHAWGHVRTTNYGIFFSS